MGIFAAVFLGLAVLRLFPFRARHAIGAVFVRQLDARSRFSRQRFDRIVGLVAKTLVPIVTLRKHALDWR